MSELGVFGRGVCPKCGTGDPAGTVRFHEASDYCTVNRDSEPGKYYAVREDAQEHLHYVCGRCGYSWGTKTADAAA